MTPWGLRKLLNWIRYKYNNIPVMVTENGMCDDGNLKDIGRINFLRAYIDEVLKGEKSNILTQYIYEDCFLFC